MIEVLMNDKRPNPRITNLLFAMSLAPACLRANTSESGTQAGAVDDLPVAEYLEFRNILGQKIAEASL